MAGLLEPLLYPSTPTVSRDQPSSSLREYNDNIDNASSVDVFASIANVLKDNVTQDRGNNSRHNVTGELFFPDPYSEHGTRVALVITYVTVFSMCFFGNILVLYVITRNMRMRTRTNLFLGNLAIADLLVGIFCIIPNMCQYLFNQWYLGLVMCQLYQFVESVNFTASMLLLEVIAVERYIAINHPLRARQLFIRYKMYFAQFLVWLVSAAYNVPLIFMYHTIEITEDNETSVYCYYREDSNIELYYVLTFVIWYVIPLVIMSIMYAKISKTLWRSSLQNQLVALSTGPAGPSTCVQSDSTNRENKKPASLSVQPKSRFTPKSSQQAIDMLPDATTDPTLTPRTNSAKTRFKNLTDEGNRLYSGRDRTLTLQPSHRASFKKSGNPDDAQHTPRVHDVKKVKEKANRFSWSSHSSESESPFYSIAEDEVVPIYKEDTDIPPTGETNDSKKCSPGSPSTSKASNSAKPNSGSVTTTASLRRYRMTSQRSSRRRVIRLLIVVLVAFSLLVLPNHIRLLLIYAKVKIPTTRSLAFFPLVCHLLMYLNSALNPILYSLLSQTFRRSLRESLACCRIRRQTRRKSTGKADATSTTKKTTF